MEIQIISEYGDVLVAFNPGNITREEALAVVGMGNGMIEEYHSLSMEYPKINDFMFIRPLALCLEKFSCAFSEGVVSKNAVIGGYCLSED